MTEENKRTLNFFQFVAIAVALWSFALFVGFQDTQAAIYWALLALFVWRFGEWRS